MNPGILFGWLPVIGIAVGLARLRFPRLPWIATGLLVGAYLTYMAAFGAYAGQCWSCSGVADGDTRGDTFFVSAIFFGILLATTLLGIWLGARLTVVFGRVMSAARDLREGLRDREDRQPR